MTTVVRNSMHGRSRTSRSRTSCAFSSFRPHPEQISFRWPRFRRIHSFSVLAGSWISCRYTRYPGHPSSLVSSLSRKLPSLPKSPRRPNSRLLAVHQIPAQSHYYFVPLVTSELSLVCSLDIVLRRRQPPGSLVKHGGDIDNRL